MLDSLQESIDKHGIVNPVVVDENYNLIDGKNRLGCVPKDAMVPCVVGTRPGTHMVPKQRIKIDANHYK